MKNAITDKKFYILLIFITLLIIILTSCKILPEITIWQAAAEGNIEQLNKNIEAGVDVNEKGDAGNSPLHLAVLLDQYEAAELLLKNGADVNIVNDRYETPIFFASFYSKINMAKLLLEYDADINIKNTDGTSALNWLQIEWTDDITKLYQALLPKENQGTVIKWIKAGREEMKKIFDAYKKEVN